MQVHTIQKDSVPDLPESHLGTLPPVLEFDSLLMGESLASLGKLGGVTQSKSEGGHVFWQTYFSFLLQAPPSVSCALGGSWPGLHEL